MTYLQLVDVSFTYGSFSPNSSPLALSNVNLRLDRAKAISLVGPNGAGKTTLLGLIGGLNKPSSGKILREGMPNVAFVSQAEQEIGWMPVTVEEIMKMASYRKRGLLGRVRTSDISRIGDAVERMEIQDLQAQQFNSLSMGQRQRVRVALAIAQEPDLLIMDEPLIGLDIPSKERIQKVTQEVKENGAAVAIATHSLEEASQAEEVLLMDGSIVAQGSPSETLTEENLRNVYKDRLQILPDNRLLVLDHHHDQPA